MCKHDYEHPIRKGRAHYVCPLCEEDITIALCYIQEALNEKAKNVTEIY